MSVNKLVCLALEMVTRETYYCDTTARKSFHKQRLYGIFNLKTEGLQRSNHERAINCSMCVLFLYECIYKALCLK